MEVDNQVGLVFPASFFFHETGLAISHQRGNLRLYINEVLRVMHILAVASDQKPVESKRAVYDPSTVCRIFCTEIPCIRSNSLTIIRE